MGETQEPNRFLDIPGEVELDDPDFAKLLRGRTVVVDMGCGHGDFMLEFTRKHPEKFYVGVEIARKRTHKTAHRLAKRDIPNYRVVSAPGELALRALFPDCSVDEIDINFPDPWLREKQWKNRILKPSFLIELLRVLKPRGVLNFVTDVEEYAQYSARLIERFPGFENNYDNLIEKNIYDSFPTLFYEKMSPLRQINYVSFYKSVEV